MLWRTLVLLYGLTLISGCVSTSQQRDFYKSYRLDQEQEVNLGSSIIIYRNVTILETERWVGLAYSSDGWQRTRVATPESIQEELIYTGRSGNALKVSYREYRNEFAQPAFYHELTYDLGISDVIVFRNYRIKVLNASNESIRFKVTKD
jgi:hypothetical protein